jgi:hypothetical protein
MNAISKNYSRDLSQKQEETRCGGDFELHTQLHSSTTNHTALHYYSSHVGEAIIFNLHPLVTRDCFTVKGEETNCFSAKRQGARSCALRSGCCDGRNRLPAMAAAEGGREEEEEGGGGVGLQPAAAADEGDSKG